jgi:hypothetical protein
VANAPNSLLVDSEGGTEQIEVNARVDAEHVRDWASLNKITDEITNNPMYKEFTTIGFDTVDWIERQIWKYIIQRDKPKTKGDYDLSHSLEAYGYNKGYEVAADEFRNWMSRLERLRATGRNIVLIGHSTTKKVSNPSGEDYEAYCPSINAKVAALIAGWIDIQMFAQFQIVVTKASKFAKAKANSLAPGMVLPRMLYTTPSPAWEAKSRYLLPSSMPLEASVFWPALASGMGEDAIKLRKKVEGVLAEIRDQEFVEKAKAWMAPNANNADAINRMLGRCAVKLQEQQDVDEQEAAAKAEAGDAPPPKSEGDEPPADMVLPTFEGAA